MIFCNLLFVLTILFFSKLEEANAAFLSFESEEPVCASDPQDVSSQDASSGLVLASSISAPLPFSIDDPLSKKRKITVLTPELKAENSWLMQFMRIQEYTNRNFKHLGKQLKHSKSVNLEDSFVADTTEKLQKLKEQMRPFISCLDVNFWLNMPQNDRKKLLDYVDQLDQMKIDFWKEKCARTGEDFDSDTVSSFSHFCSERDANNRLKKTYPQNDLFQQAPHGYEKKYKFYKESYFFK